MTERDEQFHDFVLARRAGLVRTATLLTAGDKHLAEDLVQQTLTKLYVGWPAFRRADNVSARPSRNCRRGCGPPWCSATSTTSVSRRRRTRSAAPKAP